MCRPDASVSEAKGGVAVKCKDCGTEMKDLATSTYCPNDCDLKEKTSVCTHPNVSPFNLSSDPDAVLTHCWDCGDVFTQGGSRYAP